MPCRHWSCTGCGLRWEAEHLPLACPACGRSRLYFVVARAVRQIFTRPLSRWALLEID